MILPERVLGRSSAQMIRFGPRELADPLGDVLADVADQLVVARRRCPAASRTP